MQAEIIKTQPSTTEGGYQNCKQESFTDYKDNIEEEDSYNYHRLRNGSYWQTAKDLCKVSYALFDTHYLGDEMDSIINHKKSIDELSSSDMDLDIVNSYTFLYKNVEKVIIEYFSDDMKKRVTFTGPEARHILENFKVPDYTKLRKQSYYTYFMSFLFNNAYPRSYTLDKEECTIKFTNIWIHHESKVINFYYNPNTSQFDYKLITF